MDSIANMISHINNCIAIDRGFVYIAYSKYKLNILLAIKQSGYIEKLSTLRYNEHKTDIAVEFKRVGRPLLIRNVTQVSKQGNKVYWTRAVLARKSGVFVLSTNKGVVSSMFERSVGGEVVCKLF